MRYVVFLMVLALAACAPVPQRARIVPADVVSFLQARLMENARAFHSLKGLAKLHVEVNGQRTASSQALFLMKPDNLRAETLNPLGFGQPLLVVAASGQTLTAYIPTKRQYYQGEASAETLRRFSGIPLPLEVLVGLALYEVPALVQGQGRAMVTDEGFRLTQQGQGQGEQQFEFDLSGRLWQASYYEGAELLLRISYENEGEKEDGADPRLPSVVTVEIPPSRTRLSLDLSECTPNVTIEPDRFRVFLPEGAQKLPMPPG